MEDPIWPTLTASVFVTDSNMVLQIQMPICNKTLVQRLTQPSLRRMLYASDNNVAPASAPVARAVIEPSRRFDHARISAYYQHPSQADGKSAVAFWRALKRNMDGQLFAQHPATAHRR